ncbi:MAG TPA: YraN family protein [Kofleriaceae bacterium]|jgi:putative endonuclease
MTTIQVGAANEELAVHTLRSLGYAIVERNFRVKTAEVDIVARDRDGVLCFVEVRSRADDHFGNAAETIDHVKRAKVTRGARAYLALRRPACDRTRFDVVAITGPRIDVIRDAWRLASDL